MMHTKIWNLPQNEAPPHYTILSLPLRIPLPPPPLSIMYTHRTPTICLTNQRTPYLRPPLHTRYHGPPPVVAAKWWPAFGAAIRRSEVAEKWRESDGGRQAPRLASGLKPIWYQSVDEKIWIGAVEKANIIISFYYWLGYKYHCVSFVLISPEILF